MVFSKCQCLVFCMMLVLDQAQNLFKLIRSTFLTLLLHGVTVNSPSDQQMVEAFIKPNLQTTKRICQQSIILAILVFYSLIQHQDEYAKKGEASYILRIYACLQNGLSLLFHKIVQSNKIFIDYEVCTMKCFICTQINMIKQSLTFCARLRSQAGLFRKGISISASSSPSSST